MELRHLRYFVAVAEELHFGRAAQRLGIAQPPLSQQIQRLERDLGTSLFERNRRSVRLTPAGAALLPAALDILDRAQRARIAAQKAGSGDSGTISIGFVGSAALSILPEILLRFRESFPEVILDLREMSTRDQLGELQKRRIEVGLGRISTVDPSLIATRVARERLVLAVPATLGRDFPDPVSLEIVADAPFIMSPRGLGPDFHDSARRLCADAGFSPRIVQEAIQMQTIVGLVAAGIGVALVPASIERFKREGVTYRQVDADNAYSDLAIIRRMDEISPVVRNFVELAVEMGGQDGAVHESDRL